MKPIIALILISLSLAAFSVQIPDHPGSTFGANIDEKNNPYFEDRQWGWNNDTDYDLSIIYTTDRFKAPSTSSGWRTQVNKGTHIRIDNDILPVKEPPDVNSGIGVKPTP